MLLLLLSLFILGGGQSHFGYFWHPQKFGYLAKIWDDSSQSSQILSINCVNFNEDVGNIGRHLNLYKWPPLQSIHYDDDV